MVKYRIRVWRRAAKHHVLLTEQQTEIIAHSWMRDVQKAEDAAFYRNGDLQHTIAAWKYYKPKRLLIINRSKWF